MRRLALSLMVLLLLVVGVLPSLAQEETPLPPPLPWPEPRPIVPQEQVYIRAYNVDVEINNQVATTRVQQVFVNDSDWLAEGTYIFPLPRGAAVSDLIMYVNGQPIQAQILDADTARGIYEEIVRQLRDPALLEYIGQDAIQASVFPIQPRGEVTIEIEYSHILTVENGLVQYEYPIRTGQFSVRPVESLSVNVHVVSNDEIGSVYSPSHQIAVSRDGETEFRAGYEASFVQEATSFNLYYGLSQEDIDINLLTYRESAAEPGFFLLLVAPPIEVDAETVQPRDVIIVLDQSGSMFGDKWEQAQDAAQYVLNNLNPQDRFNVVAFSTGWRIFANELQPVSEAEAATQWIDTLEAIGGTDISGALDQAFSLADEERQTVILFLTDGVPTEGETDRGELLEGVRENAPTNVRLFSFGVGDDVDTFLLDQLVQDLRGAGTYVRPEENIEAEVSALYNKIAAPVLTNIQISAGEDIVFEETYPGQPLPDLFAGTQLVIAGRYRGDGDTDITLTGEINGERQTFTYSGLSFPANAGGEALIPRLWATRRIGALLNQIRLNGENQELIDSIVRLSIRYGIITPYTSFLIEEDDIFTQQGQANAVNQAQERTSELDTQSTGAGAVSAADEAAAMEEAEAAPMPAMPFGTATPGDFAGEGGVTTSSDQSAPSVQPIQIAGDRTFLWRDGVWIDTTYNADTMTPTPVVFLSDEYFALLDAHPEIGDYLALGEHVIFVLDGQAYEIVPGE